MVLAQLLLRTVWGKALVTLAAIPFSIAKNGLRIFTLSMLGIYVDPGFLNGQLHHHGGIVFFLFALVGLFVLLCLVGWAERKTTAQPAVSYVAPKTALQRTTAQQLSARTQAKTRP
jgi:exosortase/archaeosortase family protein